LFNSSKERYELSVIIFTYKGFNVKIFLATLLAAALSASTVNLKYVGEFSIFGKVANASIYYFNDGKNYHIKVTGKGSGIVAALTQNKLYTYESLGEVKENTLLPSKYVCTESGEDFKKIKTYLFDYNSSTTVVTDYKSEIKEEYEFNVSTFKYDVTRKNEQKRDVKVLDEIYQDDMVSMFFNKRLNLLSMKVNDTKLVHAVGTRDTQEGVIVKLREKKKNRYVYGITIEKDYLTGGSEDATFVLDGDNVLYETRLGGISFFGDARIRRLN